MASRDGGATVSGTDGSDHIHRETVASQYQVSPEDEVMEEAANSITQDLPLAGDYHGIGGPDSVPLEAPTGAFEQPERLGRAYLFLTDLFMTPSDDTIRKYQITERKKLISRMKSYLSYNLYFHILITLFFLAKLSPAILDRMDIFILPLEELNIPKPMLWEWIWVGGSLLIFAMGSNAIKASKVNKITLFMGVVNAIGIIPIFYCFAVHYTDAVAYYFEPHNKIYQTWMGYPVAILWYIFGFVAMNIHFGEIYFAYVLKDAWSIKKKTN